MIVFCEKDYAEERLKRGFSKINSFYDLSTLAKYFKFIGKNKRQIKEELVNFCKAFSPEYNEVRFDDTVTKAVNTTDKYRLKVFEPVTITNKEIEAIRSTPDYRYQKILFMMLVIAKWARSHYVERISFTQICRMSKVHVTKAEEIDIAFELNKFGFIDTAEEKRYRINFVVDSKEDPYVTVDDYLNILKFLPFVCTVCGKEMEMKGKSRKMCEECYRESVRISKMNHMRRKRE